MNHKIAGIRTGVGILGDITSFFLFFSPFFTFRRIWKKKSVEEFHPYPYLAAVLNCVFWVWYGTPLVTQHNVPVVTINSIGLFLELSYLAIFFRFCNNKYRKKVAAILLGEAVFAAIIIAITVKVWDKLASRGNFVGIVSVIFGVCMYGSPLSVMYKVCKTKSVEFLPFWVCFAGFTNGIVWTVYSFLGQFDPYILAGNGIGAILATCQLILHCIYRKNTPDEKSNKPAEVQLPNVV